MAADRLFRVGLAAAGFPNEAADGSLRHDHVQPVQSAQPSEGLFQALNLDRVDLPFSFSQAWTGTGLRKYRTMLMHING